MIKKYLQEGTGNERYRVILLVEYLSKNCGINYFRFLLETDFCEILLKILEKRRKKFYIYNRLISGDKEKQTKVELID